MTPEQAFEKWWDKYEAWPEDGLDTHVLQAFLAGHQYQETNQLMVLADIRKAVGDGEGRLTQEELVKRIEGLVSPWRDIESAPKDGTAIIARNDEYGARETHWKRYADGTIAREGFLNGDPMYQAGGSWKWLEPIHNWVSSWEPTHWMPLPAGPAKSVTTEKEEA